VRNPRDQRIHSGQLAVALKQSVLQGRGHAGNYRGPTGLRGRFRGCPRWRATRRACTIAPWENAHIVSS
jgi:hypothetical protein